MGRIKTIARRSFLIGSVAIAGGVAFGIYAYKREGKNPLLDTLAPGEASFNPYVKVDANGVTLITPRADVGQGAYSIQAHLIAEEMDVDLATVRIDPGPPSAVYYNGVVGIEAMPIAATSETFLANTGRGAADVAGKFLGLQLTGGSTTVPDMFDRLRHAGAVARATLIAAAAEQTGLPADQLRTDMGAVVLPDGVRLEYADLAATAAEIEPVQEVTLKDPSDWKYLGKPQQRTDILAKSTGTQTYGIDMVMDGMVYATTRTNPAQGGAIRGFDASTAKERRGVKAVLPITGGVAVIADNTWRAFQAAAEVKCDWDDAPYIGDSDKQFAAVAAAFDPARQDSRFRDEGDVDAAFEAAAEVIEAEYRIPYLAHAPLEPMSAMVLLAEGRLDIWTGTQIPRFMQANAAKRAGLEAENVHVHVLMSGGSFGRRLEDDYVLQAVEIAMQLPDVPIKMVWSREEDFTHDFPRPLAMSRARGTVSDGKIAAYDLAVAAPSTAESQMARLGQPVMGPDMAIVQSTWDQPFAIPDYRVTGYRVPAMVPVSSWRSVGASGNGFLHECFIDELCLAAGADPLEERLRLCSHDVSRKVLEAVGEMSGWGSEMAQGRGRGLAFVLAFGVPVAQVIEVTDVEGAIRIDKVFVAADVGRVIDPVNFEAQVSGGVIFGLGHAMNCELTYKNGVPQQDNYHAYEGMRLYQCPEVVVRGLENGTEIRGIGEPGVPPSAPALANAIFAATGSRIRTLPLSHSVRFV
ncbi:isoquinoline 1-oxidoreductase, beta subunit [Sulfitobacter brevis]|uniref:Isoquinoline 1-oxidoreductase, beta subunit n=1 Tax=Sulfitobacter brevis TaxID=74348 RepID=A0A1I2BUN8_9RHOB|nr:molybdopterin cofactor-binding domain-containing protein [Sulfitobacter brevis]SFE59030.1 isoquinoline 1-oxidoreductase, beta subunit [Sulfitobacter brevis]